MCVKQAGAKSQEVQVSLIIVSLAFYSNENEQLWAWEYQTEEGSHNLYIEIGEEVRLVLTRDSWRNIYPLIWFG